MPSPVLTALAITLLAMPAIDSIDPLAAESASGADEVHQEDRDGDSDRQPERFRDFVDVRLQQFVIRVVDSHGQAIRGLTPEDFEFRDGKTTLPVVGVDWVSSDSPEPLPLASPRPNSEIFRRDESADSPTPDRRHRRMVVFWVQADFNAIRIKGHLRMLPVTQILIDSLGPNDLAAVVTFDSHLKLFQDFTNKKQAIADAIERSVRFGNKPDGRLPGALAIGDYLDSYRAKRAATPEEALVLTAEALEQFEGEKEIIYLGWGLGQRGDALKGRLRRAERALNRAKASVFVLDVTDADFHDLEVGLRTMAHSTGGTYAKTNRFSLQVTRRLARTLNGYYVVSVDVSGRPGAALRITVPGLGSKAVVLVRSG